MTQREQAVRRLREASQRVTAANEALDAAHAELVSAALALDFAEHTDGENEQKP